MAVLAPEVAHDDMFDRRRGRMQGLVAELRERTALVALRRQWVASFS